MKTIQQKLNVSFWIANAISAILLSSCWVQPEGLAQPGGRVQIKTDGKTMVMAQAQPGGRVQITETVVPVTGLSCEEEMENPSSASEESQTERITDENVRKEALYYPTGELKEIRIYSNETHKPHGKWEEYYQNGQLKMVKYYENGKELEKFEAYYENGKLAGVGDDKKIEEYYQSGKLKMIGHIKDGKPHGKIVQYYENGKLEKLVNAKDGNLDGIWKSCDENGKLFSGGNYIDGKKDGRWIEKWRAGLQGNAEVIGSRMTVLWGDEIGYYKNGEKNGKWEKYDWNGRLKSVNYYQNGKLVR